MKSINVAEWDGFYSVQFPGNDLLWCCLSTGAGRREMEGVCGAEGRRTQWCDFGQYCP